MADESYQWKITLADGTIKEEYKDDKFDVNWEKPGAVKSIELIGEKAISCNLETGEFNINGNISTPSDIDGPKSLYFRKRRQVRTDGINIIGSRTRYIIGYTVNGKVHTASIQPKVGVMPEEIELPGEAQAKVETPPKEESPVQTTADFKEDLIALKGIGNTTANQILELAKNKEELSKVPRDTLIDKLRDDVVVLLDGYLGR